MHRDRPSCWRLARKDNERFRQLLKEVFQDKISIFAHLRIERGSVIVRYVVPQSCVWSLIELAKSKDGFHAKGRCVFSADRRDKI